MEARDGLAAAPQPHLSEAFTAEAHVSWTETSLVAKGETFLRSVPLPGELGGGQHLSVVLSSSDYHRGGSAIIAPLRRLRPNGFRRAVYQHEFAPAIGYMPLDQDRVIDLGQVVSVPTQTLGRKAGVISRSALERVDDVLPKQFQFDGPWEIRGCVWRLSSEAPVARAVLIMNDDALDNDRVAYFNAVEATEAGPGRDLIVVPEEWLEEELEPLSDSQQDQLSDFLASAFAVPRAAS